MDEVNNAEFIGGPLPEGLSALTLKVQIILDQLGMSPGVIDGINGRNVAKAIAGAEVLAGLPVEEVRDLAGAALEADDEAFPVNVEGHKPL